MKTEKFGEINIGQLIIPKKYEKFNLDDKNEIKKLSFLLRGGKCHSMKSVNEHCKSTKDIPGPTQMSTITISQELLSLVVACKS